ncbi:MAG: LLM class flavin-dependent oxidoreductase [Pseudomonadales bacterium]
MSSNSVPLGLNLGIWDRMSNWQDTVEIARLADELGYSTLLLPESFGRDGVTLCDRLLAATKNINVCFGIANVFSRSPAVLASTAATLDELSGGRFILGLGGSTPNLVEGWHGLEFKKPLLRTRETIDICRKIWARDKSPYEGEIFKTGGVKLTFTPLRESIPIWQGAVLDKGIATCADKADGWIPSSLPLESVKHGLGIIDERCSANGRDASQISSAPTFQLAAHENAEQLLPLVKFGIAMYYGAANSPYAKAAIGLGYGEEVQELQAAYADGGAPAAAEVCSERLARSVALVGSVDECRQQIQHVLAAGASQVMVTMPGGTRAECEPILAGIRP